MKILMALMSLDIGGVETHVLELSKELVARGHKIVVASAGGSYVAQLEASGVHHVTAPLVSKKPGDIMKSYKILKSLIKEFKPDIVHSHARIPSLVCHLIHKTDKYIFFEELFFNHSVNGLFQNLKNRTECFYDILYFYYFHF